MSRPTTPNGKVPLTSMYLTGLNKSFTQRSSSNYSPVYQMAQDGHPTVNKRTSKVASSKSRVKSNKKHRGGSPANIFEPLVELRPTSKTATEKSSEETYKHLQAQLARSHKRSQKLNLIRRQDSNQNPFVTTLQDPTPSQTLEAESRRNEALLEIYTDSGTFSKVVAMTAAASVLDTKMPCDITQVPLDGKKREELYKFCHDVSAILGIQDMKSIDGNDYRRLWHLCCIFTSALDQQHHGPDENILTSNSTYNISNGRIGRLTPLEETVSDADLVENIKNTNPTLYSALSDPLKRFLIVYGRYIDAGHVVKSKNLRCNGLNDQIKRYRERMSFKPRVTVRQDSPTNKTGGSNQPMQNLKILQNLNNTTESLSKKLAITESDVPSLDSADSFDSAKYSEDVEFGSNHLLEKIKNSRGMTADKRKEETSWIQAYHRSERDILWKEATLVARRQAKPSPVRTPHDIRAKSTAALMSPPPKRPQARRKIGKAKGSATSIKTALKKQARRRPIPRSVSTPDSTGAGHTSMQLISTKMSSIGATAKSSLQDDMKKKTHTQSLKRKRSKKLADSKARSLQPSKTASRTKNLLKKTKSQKDEALAIKGSPSVPRCVSYTSKSRILYREAIYRGIMPKPKGDAPGLCPARCKTICLEGCRYDVVRRVALESGFKEVGEHDVWNVIWTDVPISMEKALEMRRFQNAHTIFWGTSPPVQKANHFPGMNEICRKDRLARNLNRMKKSFPDDYNFFPRTWSLPADVADLLMYSRVKKNATYICKPDSGCQGKGIFLARNLKKLNPFAKLICQVYIPKPLLIDGYKFDLRIYILVTCCDPLRVFIYNEGIARLATIKYNPPNDTNIDMIYMHLTNYSLNKFSQSYDTHGDGSKRKLSSVMNTLEAGGCDVGKLRDAIDSVIVKTMIAAQPTLRHYYRASFPKHEYGSACFEILGFDILIDQNLKPFLLEVNHSPSFNLDLPVDAEIKEALLKDVFNIIYLGTANDLKSKKTKRKQSVPSSVGSSESTAVKINKNLQSQFTHENKHCGNFRLIYPIENGTDYGEFFDQLSNPSMLTDPSLLTRKKLERVVKTKSVV